ncbi:hypothetical protein [Amycolatopsis samaneae]
MDLFEHRARGLFDRHHVPALAARSPPHRSGPGAPPRPWARS